jgi:hypothetical protein
MFYRILIVLFITQISFAQEKSSRFSVSAYYGPAYNFFVDYGRPVNKEDGYFIPPVDPLGGLELIQKNAIGTVGGLQVSYRFKTRNRFSIGYTREQHIGKFNGMVTLSNGTPVFVNDIRLRHLNEFFELNYKRAIGKSLNWYFTIGFYVLNPSQAELHIYPSQNFVEISERNNKNSNLQEGGFSLGAEYFFYQSGQFQFGVTSKLYFTASTGEFETLTFSPLLKYKF